MKTANILYVVVPCYKEEEVLPETAARLADKLGGMIADGRVAPQSRIMFVNDGSSDKTWEIICNLHEGNPLFAGVNLSRNRGHQNALLAGLMVAKDHADITISMDADLQDDIDAMDEMLAKHEAGADIVYGVRSKRETDSFFKRRTALGFYKIMRTMGIEIVSNHADYRLMSKRALEGLAQFREVNLFLRGIVPMIGYNTAIVHYERAERFAGETKYPLKKMLALAFEGITSLTIRPIRIISMLGLLTFLISAGFLVYVIIDFARGGTVAGWTSTIASIWGIGGLQLLAIGIIGEYIGKIYLEVKQRPRYIIEQTLISQLINQPELNLDKEAKL
ncbi:MAG: glycosyltransferase family 2 protein [Defluviitaleaceae bacterium]|nr:glycosyltransferase family 2 protein [Defluviitaleaceae bacterium]